MKNLKAENPCNMDLLSGGGGQAEQSRGTCVSKWRVERATGKPRFGRKRERRRLTRGAVVITVNQCFVGTRQCDKQASTTMPPLRPERKWREQTNSATIDYRCVEFDRRESTESTAIMGLRARGQCLAFTMAEILLSLTIIGVVAAITLPSLTGNINERTWNTQRKALYARFSQAIALMPALNGYGVLKEESSAGASDAEDTAAETFVTSGLSSVLKINNICDNEHLEDCGIVSKITTLAGSQIDFPDTMGNLNSLMVGAQSTATESISILDTKAAAFETQNGESIAVYYNPNCVGDLQNLTWGGSTGYFGQTRVCANFIYDLNGNKGPNTVGKDIGFMTLMYPSDPKISAPIPAQAALSGGYAMSGDNNATQACTAYDSEYRVPNMEELYSMFVNKNLLNSAYTASTWSSTSVVSGGELHKFFVRFTNGELDDLGLTYPTNVWCIKR